MPRFFLCLTILVPACITAGAQETATVRLADGFGLPVGLDGQSYYKARGFRPNGHLGEDWNGKGGGDTDLGAPVYSTGHGLVVFARDYRAGWGNVVIIRHAYMENGRTEFADSLYGHLDEILVKENQQVTRGQKIGTIGNNRGMYDAHLHFELRRNILIGMHRHRFPRDFTSYWDPTSFITARSTLPGGAKVVSVPINTFNTAAGPVAEVSEDLPVAAKPTTLLPSTVPKPPVIRRTPFKVDRFQDLRDLE